MNTHPNLSVGVYDHLDKAQATIDLLRQRGFGSQEIGVIGHVGDEATPIPSPTGMTAPEYNVTSGVLYGGVIGMIIGLLVIVVVPALSQFGGGRWFDILAGGVIGAAAGGYLIAFERLFLSRRRAGAYEAELEKGHFLVFVKGSKRQEEAVQVLSQQAVHSGVDAGE